METPKLDVLIVGATGHLGCLITKHALENPKLRVHILVRDPSKNKQLTSQVTSAGGRVIAGDLTDSRSLKDATTGIHTVISAMNSYDEKIAVDGQRNLLKECIDNGVTRFSPSDYGINYTYFSRDELYRTAVVSPKIKFQDYLDKTSLKQLHFHQGNIMEMFFNIQSQGFGYWGDPSIRFDLTTYDDIAKVVASAISNPDLTGVINYVGDKKTIFEIAEIYNKLRGTNVQPKNKGSMEDLKKMYDELRQKGDPNAEFFGLFLLQADKRSVFEKTSNTAFPNIKPKTVEEFLKQNPDIKLG